MTESRTDWWLRNGLRRYLLGLGFLSLVTVIVVAGTFVYAHLENKMSLDACVKLIRKTTPASEELVRAWYFQPVHGEALGICRKRTPKRPDPYTSTWRRPLVGVKPATNDCGTDSECGDYYDGDPYNHWLDLPDEPPGWEPFDNGREWMNDPDDTWGDGR